MISKEDIQRKYAVLSTDELLAIVRDEGGFTDIAISVAKEELQKRNVTAEQEQDFQEREEQTNAIVLQKAFAELSILQKSFFYFIWFPLLHFPVKQNLREDRYVLKVRQAGYYSLSGFIAFFITAFISVAFDLTNWPALLIWVLLIIPAFGLDNFFNKKPQSL